MRRLKDTSLVPPDDFRFTHETGYTTTARTYNDWVERAKEHRTANNLGIPLDFAVRMQDQLCGLIPPEWCSRDAGDVSSWVDTRFSWNDFTEGMKVFGHWAALGTPLVEQKEADRRAAICVSCPLNVAVSGCASCHKIASMITGAVAKKRGAHDDHLRACAICRCSLKAMVWFPMEILRSNESADRQALRPDFCWVKENGPQYIPPPGFIANGN
jgi:hypothetical protein